jgi:hypothetical protein
VSGVPVHLAQGIDSLHVGPGPDRDRRETTGDLLPVSHVRVPSVARTLQGGIWRRPAACRRYVEVRPPRKRHRQGEPVRDILPVSSAHSGLRPPIMRLTRYFPFCELSAHASAPCMGPMVPARGVR